MAKRGSVKAHDSDDRKGAFTAIDGGCLNKEMTEDIFETKTLIRKLTTRETQLLKLAAEGYTDKEMAMILGISRETVTTYWKRLKQKYRATNRTSLVVALIGKANNQVHEDTESPIPTEGGGEASVGGDDADLDYHNLFDELGFGVLFESNKGATVLSNRLVLEMLGLQESEETPDGSFRDLLLKAGGTFRDFDAVLTTVGRLAAEQQLSRAIPIQMTDGRILDLDYTPVFREDALLGHLWHFRDVTTVREDKSIVGLHGQRAIQAIDQHPEPRMTLSPTGHIEYMNPAAEKIFGIELAAVKGKLPDDMIVAFWTPWFKQLLGSVEIGAGRKRGEGSLEGLKGWYLVSITRWAEGTVLSFQDRTKEWEQNLRMRDLAEFAEIIGMATASLIAANDEGLFEVVRGSLGQLASVLGGSWATVYLLNREAASESNPIRWKADSSIGDKASCLSKGPIDLEVMNGQPGPFPMMVNPPEAPILEQRMVLPLRESKGFIGYVEFDLDPRHVDLCLQQRTALTVFTSCLLVSLRRLKMA